MSGRLLATSASVRRLQRPARLVRYFEPGLVPVAGALWLWNLYVLIG